MAKRKRRTIKKHGPHPTDVHVGSRVQMRRTLLGMSQNELSAAVGLAFQQIHQNETGAIRIGAGRRQCQTNANQVAIAFLACS